MYERHRYRSGRCAECQVLSQHSVPVEGPCPGPTRHVRRPNNKPQGLCEKGHDLMKRSARNMRAWTRFIGFQADGAGGRLEMRNCTICETTLCCESFS